MFSLSKERQEGSALWMLHLTVFIWGFTAILGKLITINALPLVWYRMLIAFIALIVYQIAIKKFKLPNRRTLGKLGAIGAIVSIHWFFFYHTIKISNISVALVTLSSSAVFAGFLGPAFNKHKISKLDIGFGIIILFGIYLIFHFETDQFWGIITGILSALCATIFTLLNEQEVKKGDPINISIIEMLAGFLCLSFYLFFVEHSNLTDLKISSSDLFYLLILGIVCTAFAYVSGIRVMKKISAFKVILVTNLEPVYGILLAFLIFGESERMTGGFYFGTTVILTAVFLYPVAKRKSNERKNLVEEGSGI